MGIERCDRSEIVGGTPERNAEITLSVLTGEKSAARNAVLLNAAAAIYIANYAKTIKGAVKLAEDVIDSGKAIKTLNRYIKATKGA